MTARERPQAVIWWVLGAVVFWLSLAMVVVYVNRDDDRYSAPVIAVVPSAATPAPVRYDIPMPYPDCRGDGIGAGLGWTVYGVAGDRQLSGPWDQDLPATIRRYRGTTLEIRIAWYCPPR